MTKYLLSAAVALCALSATPASAATYMFAFAGAQFSGTGTFETSDTPDANGGVAILTTTGTVTNNNNGNTFNISGPTGFAGADNLLFPNAAQLVSFDGTSFIRPNGTEYNLYYSPGVAAYRLFTSNSQFFTLDSFTVELAGVVPEPASWALMIGGMGLVGGALRVRARKVALAA